MCRNKHEEIKVSVIVPVWNPGAGISRCIGSLRNQTLTDIEMIFVDDCGTDDSMEKVRFAASQDPRIRIIENTENIGAGPSRNRGIEAAKGEYLSFVDPDDYVADNFLELLYLKARLNSFDIVKGCFVRKKKDGLLISTQEKNQQIRDNLATNKPLYLLFIYQHQSAIYRKEFVISKSIQYGSSRRSADVTFLLIACSKAKSFSTADDALYYFCERGDSTSNTVNSMQLMGTLQALRERNEYILDNLKNDVWAAEYLYQAFFDGIRSAELYINNPNAEEALSEYASGLRYEWLRIPHCKDIAKRSFSLQCLQDYGILLPPKPVYSVWENRDWGSRYVRLVELWINFYIGKAKENEACWKDLRKLIIEADKALENVRNAKSSIEEYKAEEARLKKVIRKLPLKLRLQISVIKAKYSVARILPSSIKKTITVIHKRGRC